MPTKGYRTAAERDSALLTRRGLLVAAEAVAATQRPKTQCPKCERVSINTTCPICVVPTVPVLDAMTLAHKIANETPVERPNRMSFGEQVVEAIGEHIDARIEYAETRRGVAAEYANGDEVTKTGERLQALLDKVRFAL